MNNLQPYHWQQQQWSLLQNRYMHQKLPHALLLGGQQGVGKQQFTRAFIYKLLCQNGQQQLHACGKCRSCTLLRKNGHPDLLYIEPDATGKAIKINQIHSITNFLHKTAFFAQYRIAIISQADAMNHSAANALLKILEEPGEGSIIMLNSDRSSILPATIRSRCYIMTFPAVNYEDAKSWLKENYDIEDTDLKAFFSLTRGSPLNINKYISGHYLQQREKMINHILMLLDQRCDPIAVAKEYLDFDMITFFDDLSECLLDIIKIYLNINEKILSLEYFKLIQQAKKNIDLFHLFQVVDQLKAYKEDIVQGIMFNKQLLLESILCSCQGQVIQN